MGEDEGQEGAHMTVTLHRNALALEVRGHGDPLYVSAADVPLLVHGQMAVLRRFVDSHLEDAGIAVMRPDGDQVLFRVGLDGAAAWYSAPYTPAWSLSRGLSDASVPLEVTEAP
jgi:hypothetical protein